MIISIKTNKHFYNTRIKLQSKLNLFKNQIYNFTNKSDQENNDKFFYENINIEKENSNIISIAKDSKFIEKMRMEETAEKPFIDNEAYRELYKNFSLFIGEETSKELDTIIHNEEVNGKKYKYGLLAKNELPFTELIPKDEVEEIPKTSTENLFDLLDLDKESSYESMILKIQQEFNHGKNC